MKACMRACHRSCRGGGGGGGRERAMPQGQGENARRGREGGGIWGRVGRGEGVEQCPKAAPIELAAERRVGSDAHAQRSAVNVAIRQQQGAARAQDAGVAPRPRLGGLLRTRAWEQPAAR
eukprot:SM000035S13128  [mRNA]  locus=s35:688052:688581:+ [translate_table: standard]